MMIVRWIAAAIAIVLLWALIHNPLGVLFGALHWGTFVVVYVIEPVIEFVFGVSAKVVLAYTGINGATIFFTGVAALIIWLLWRLWRWLFKRR